MSKSRLGIRSALLLSLLLHALLFMGWTPEQLLQTLQPFEQTKDGKPAGSLAVRLAPPTSRRADAEPMVPRAPSLAAPRASASAALKRPAQRPSPQVLSRQAPQAPAVAAPPSVPGDLAAYIEARRREREPEPVPAPSAAPAPPVESEQERDNRQVAENLGFNRLPVFGAGQRTGGGIFELATVRYDSAEFFFYGWNKQIRRNAQQMIEVRRGDNASIQLAVVRRMVALIREQAAGNFVWESVRLRRDVTLSAAPAENAGLEEFLLKEFFPDYRR